MRAIRLTILFAVGIGSLSCLHALQPRPEGQAELVAPRGESFFDLTLDAPVDGQRATAPVPWLEVRGRTGFAELFESDVVIVLDLSDSALLASGIDLDEDGVVGENNPKLGEEITGFRKHDGTPVRRADRLPMRRWTSDADDSIVLAELEAAHSIVSGLWPRKNRIGVVTYKQRARVRTEIGEPRLASAAIDQIPVPRSRSKTDVSAALIAAQRLLERPYLQTQPRRDRVILLFTDGSPNHPGAEAFARARARRVAAENAAQGTRLYVLSFGNLDERRARFVVELVAAGNGLLVPVRDPKRLLQDLPPVALAPEALEIWNRTLDRPARAVRAGRHGRYEGFVPLAEGDNEIEVTAILASGRRVEQRRVVHYAPSAEPTPAERREVARLLVALRERTRELERSERTPLAPERLDP